MFSTACDSGSEPGGVAAANVTGEAISLSRPNARAALTLTVSQTITSSTPIFDAASGQMTTTVTASEPVRQYALHSGLTPDGAFAFDLTATGSSTGLTDEMGSVSIRQGVLVATNRLGAEIAGTHMGLHTALGTSGSDPLAVMGGLAADQLPAVGELAARGASQATVTSVTTSGALTTITASVSDGEAGQPATTQTRTYLRRNLKYVLQEMRTDITSESPGSQAVRQVRMQFTNVVWSRGMDAAAASATTSGTSSSIWGAGADQDILGVPPLCPPEEYPCANPNGSGSPSGPGSSNTSCSSPPLTPTGANIVYVHGINAEGSTWGSPSTDDVVRGKNRCDLVLAGDMAPSLMSGGLKGLGRHSEQATQLQDSVRSSGLSNFIFVGHSQGGLISRRAARGLQGTAGAPSVRGVVTTGTPHLGARIANNATLLGIPGRIGQTFGGGYACRVTTQCSAVVQAANALQDQFPGAVLSSNAMQDLRPSSPAIQEVNAQPESFRRFGIQNALTSHSFLLYQIAGDAALGNRGRLVREVATAVSIVALATSIVSTVVAIVLPWVAIVAAAAAVVFAAIVGADLAWSTLTYGNRPSDGVVENTSQAYPLNSPGTFQPINRQSLDPSSHTAQSDSERSAEDIQRTLSDRLGVARR